MQRALFALDSAGQVLEGSVGAQRHLLVRLQQTLVEASTKPSVLGNSLCRTMCYLPFLGASETEAELNSEVPSVFNRDLGEGSVQLLEATGPCLRHEC